MHLHVNRGLVTRNMKASVDHFHEHHLQDLPPFWPALCRETFHAFKPSPEPLLHIAGEWGIDPEEMAMIGDSASNDVVSGNRAGALTILLSERDLDPSAPGENVPDYKVNPYYCSGDNTSPGCLMPPTRQ